MEDNSEPLINDHEDGRGSFNDWKEEKRELRSDMEKADQEGERISTLFKSSECGCFVFFFIQGRKLLRNIISVFIIEN